MFRLMLMIASILGLIACGGNSVVTDTAPEKGEFVGHYVGSFEVSSYVPCIMNDRPGYGAGYWLEADPESGFFEEYDSYISKSSPRENGAIVFVRVLGELSPPQNISAGELGYGHLNQYPRRILVTKVIEMVPHANDQCPK